MKFIFTFLLAGVLLFHSGKSLAEEPAEAARIQEIEEYLNSIDTAVAEFMQVAPDGTISTGMFYLDRPGHLRWQYEPPTPVLIIADGDRLIYYDYELEQVSYLDIEDTLAGFLARDTIDFSGDVQAVKLEEEAQAVRVTLERRGDPDQGQLTLIFTERPMILRKLEVRDTLGKLTHVALNNLKLGVELEDALFEFRDPTTNRRLRRN